jgi:hypothetical protein
MKKYIVYYSDNWADEMDISGFFTCTKKYKKQIKKKLSSYDEEYTYCIGSNEDIDYENGQAILDTLTFKKISNKEFKTLSKLFYNTDYYETDEEMVENYIYDELDKKYDSEDTEIGEWEKISEKIDIEFEERFKNLSKEDFNEILEKVKKSEGEMEIEYGFNPLEDVLEEIDFND